MKDRLIKLFNNIVGFKLINKLVINRTTDKKRKTVVIFKYELNKDYYNKILKDIETE